MIYELTIDTKNIAENMNLFVICSHTILGVQNMS